MATFFNLLFVLFAANAASPLLRGSPVANLTDDACYATPGVYSPPCRSSSGLIPAYDPCFTSIRYTIHARSAVGAFCRVLGAAYCDARRPGVSCAAKFVMLDGGQVDIEGTDVDVMWGDAAGTPAISCMGDAGGVGISWSWTAPFLNPRCQSCTATECWQNCCIGQDCGSPTAQCV